MRYLVILVVICSAAGCEKDKKDHRPEESSYQGTFRRYPNGKTVSVRMKFFSGYFSGMSEEQTYPAIGGGSAYFNEDHILFRNTSLWTANFDGTLILEGPFIHRITRDSLIFSKSYGNGEVDVYSLRRE